VNSEFNTLTKDQQAAVRRCVGAVQSSPRCGQKSERLPNGDEAYAYPGYQGTCWGLNSAETGYNKARGVWPKGKQA